MCNPFFVGKVGQILAGMAWGLGFRSVGLRVWAWAWGLRSVLGLGSQATGEACKSVFSDGV